MARGEELKAVLKLMGVVDPSLLRAFKDAEKAMSPLEKSMRQTSADLLKIGSSMEKAGKALTKTVTLPIVAAGTAAVKLAVDWESAWAGVQKTNDGTMRQMADLHDGLLSLSKEIPTSATELAGLAENAGQLGIEVDNVLGFTRVMADLMETTNLSSEGATQLARFANITRMSQQDFDRLGSSIVDLGNNYATTESEIVDMGLRMAAAGKQVGMSEAEIMGWSAALSSVGLEAQAGGSSWSKIVSNMQLASEMGGESLEQFAAVAGTTSAGFAGLFKKDATKAMTLFIRGLSKGEDSAIKLLNDMGITEIRTRDELLRLANAGSLVTEAVATSTGAWAENTALTNEANIRYGTMASRMSVVVNRLKGMGIAFGQTLMPYLEKAVNWVDGLIGKFEGMDEATRGNIVRVGAFAATAGPVLLVLGKLVKGAGKFIGLIGAFAKAKSLVNVAGGMEKLTGASKAFGMVMKALSGPGGWIALAVAGIAALALVVKKFQDDALKTEWAKRFGNSITLSSEEMASAVRSMMGPINASVQTYQDGMASIRESQNGFITQTGEVQTVLMQAKLQVDGLTKEDQDALVESVGAWIDGAREQIQNTDQGALLAVNALYGADDPDGANFAAQYAQYFTGIDQMAAEKGKEIKKALLDAIADGTIGADEWETITNLNAELMEILERGTLLSLDPAYLRLEESIANGTLSPESLGGLKEELAAYAAEMLVPLDEARLQLNALEKMRFEAGDISEAAYQANVQSHNDQYNAQRLATEAKAAGMYGAAIANSFGTAYAEEMAALGTLEDMGLLSGENMARYYESAMNELAFMMGRPAEELQKMVSEDAYLQGELLGFMQAEFGRETDRYLNDAGYGWMERGAFYQAVQKALADTGASSEDLKAQIAALEAANQEIPEALLNAYDTISKMELLTGLDASSDPTSFFTDFLSSAEGAGLLEAGQAATADYLAGGVQGLSDGSALDTTAAGLGTGMDEAFSGAIGVQSPSWMAEAHGIDYAQGAINGVTGRTAQMTAASQALSAAALEPTQQMVTTMAGEVALSWSLALQQLVSYMNAAATTIRITANNMANAVIAAVQRAASAMASLSGGGGSGSKNKTSGSSASNKSSVPKYAAGGTLDTPTLALIAEAGRETVVPHNSKPRSRSLALEALRGTGLSLGGGGGAPVFAPDVSVTVQGSADESVIQAAVKAALEEAFELFEQWWAEKERNDERESYAW